MTHSDPEAENYLARGFRDVDAAAVGKMARCLEYLDSLPEFRQYKTQILGLMKPQRGSVTADLGCGLGFDVRRLSRLVGPEGRAIGVDSSTSLLASARSASEGFPSVEFIQADIQNLPFANGFLNSCKVDRTLQHVERPVAVLNEMFRTVCSGGTVVCAEPDWGTFAIDDTDRAMARQIAEIWSESFRHPRIGSQLNRYLEEVGFVEIRVQEALLTTPSFESSDMLFDITQTALRLAVTSGSGEPLAWLAKLRERDRRVCSSVTLVINFARRS
jgi:ubiquinone/menaquinone biosynthesis C-methylase UbiE